MSKKLLKNNRGIAILIVITIITLLMAVAIELNRKVRTAVMLTGTNRDNLTLFYMASSGIHAAIAILIKDKGESEFDSLLEDWANPSKIEEVLSTMNFENGKVTFKITDEMSKIQVNALADPPEGKNFNEPQKAMWDRCIRLIVSKNEVLKNADVDITGIINCVKDWIDKDDIITGLNGAESEYYKGLTPPYSPRNAPILYLEELKLIKEFREEFFLIGEKSISNYMTVYGIASDDKKEDKKEGPPPPPDDDEKKKGVKYDGKININTVDLPVLIAMVPSENIDIARSIYDYRQEAAKNIDFSNPTWYKNAPGATDIVIDPKIITTSSNYFAIESTATIGQMKTTLNAVVKREKDKKTDKIKCNILFLKVE
ncbi:MAG: general secretion pathway protein GspK [Desulfobacterales bacterium]|nr:general secretion pathway protein GspK [Desulfobacterales bacterium]MBF0396704.1 general secretion pathway protein GspK [Desulfobacterales bacterium]